MSRYRGLRVVDLEEREANAMAQDIY